MSLSHDQVQRLALLARIAVGPGETDAVLAQLNRVLELIEQMQKVDTRGVEPMAHALDLRQRVREDSVTERDQHALFQSVAPAVERGLYLVPKVIE
ncbi:MAG: Asp-tRNA(Asn)/Glu-tRNA(Gln) amidotransferase subunit GatC [Betaproteobacteria bacterium]|nr:Asp-tRNA(Asn)/Glu-tRNA(Gln) amidotransferase subunit GatC [Betaproteobacteria bacterium]